MQICYRKCLKIHVTIHVIFCISKPSWRNIYKSKVLCMYDKRLSEFNYKLLNNMLCFNLFLEKCKIRLNAKCDHCDEDSDDIMHLIYG